MRRAHSSGAITHCWAMFGHDLHVDQRTEKFEIRLRHVSELGTARRGRAPSVTKAVYLPCSSTAAPRQSNKVPKYRRYGILFTVQGLSMVILHYSGLQKPSILNYPKNSLLSGILTTCNVFLRATTPNSVSKYLGGKIAQQPRFIRLR